MKSLYWVAIRWKSFTLTKDNQNVCPFILDHFIDKKYYQKFHRWRNDQRQHPYFHPLQKQKSSYWKTFIRTPWRYFTKKSVKLWHMNKSFLEKDLWSCSRCRFIGNMIKNTIGFLVFRNDKDGMRIAYGLLYVSVLEQTGLTLLGCIQWFSSVECATIQYTLRCWENHRRNRWLIIPTLHGATEIRINQRLDVTSAWVCAWHYRLWSNWIARIIPCRTIWNEGRVLWFFKMSTIGKCNSIGQEHGTSFSNFRRFMSSIATKNMIIASKISQLEDEAILVNNARLAVAKAL